MLVLVLPSIFLSSLPFERSSFSGNESMLGMAIFVVLLMLAAMTFITVFAALMSALISALFRRH